MTNGIKIAKVGNDVTKATSDQLYVDSSTPLFKLFESGSGSQTFLGIHGEEYFITINHSLSYRSFILFFMDRLPGSARQLVTSSQATQLSLSNPIGCSIFSIQPFNFIVFTDGFGGTPQAGTYGYNYFIYYETIEP